MNEAHLSDLKAPVAVVMISLNEGHNMEAAVKSLQDWAQEIFLVDSYSQDDTVDIALRHGVKVVQRRFKGFGDQWNFAMRRLPIQAPWTMKLDLDERLSDELKMNLKTAMEQGTADGFSLQRHLWFMGKTLPVRQRLTRVWRTGSCRFTDVSVNEHPIVEGLVVPIEGDLEHHDSPDMDHWLEKQNRYTTAEAIAAFRKLPMADEAILFGSALQRQMWLKKHYKYVPGRHLLLFLYYWLVKGTWRAGWPGYIWARLRADVMRFIEYKHREIELCGRLPGQRRYGRGGPDGRVKQSD